ncbi:hypothetical protein LTR94_030772, partial [Friedmanniomyces endolithicus]
LTDSVSLFGELFFTHRESNQAAAPGALRDIRIAADHPTNPTGQDLLLIRRLLVEPGQRQFFQETDTYRFVGGARGDIAGDWTWEASANWGRNTGVDGMTNIVNLRQARKAKARVDKAKTAEENRARFGRTKAQRQADSAEEHRRAALLDGVKLDRDGAK